MKLNYFIRNFGEEKRVMIFFYQKENIVIDTKIRILNMNFLSDFEG